MNFVRNTTNGVQRMLACEYEIQNGMCGWFGEEGGGGTFFFFYTHSHAHTLTVANVGYLTKDYIRDPVLL